MASEPVLAGMYVQPHVPALAPPVGDDQGNLAAPLRGAGLAGLLQGIGEGIAAIVTGCTCPVQDGPPPPFSRSSMSGRRRSPAMRFLGRQQESRHLRVVVAGLLAVPRIDVDDVEPVRDEPLPQRLTHQQMVDGMGVALEDV